MEVQAINKFIKKKIKEKRKRENRTVIFHLHKQTNHKAMGISDISLSHQFYKIQKKLFCQTLFKMVLAPPEKLKPWQISPEYSQIVWLNVFPKN